MNKAIFALLAIGMMLATAFGGCIGGEKQAPSENEGKGWIYGTVTNDTEAPITGAELSIEGASYAAATGVNGTYKIEGINSGTYAVACAAAGYDRQNQSNVIVEAGKGAEVNFQLKKSSSGGQGETGVVTWYLHNPGGEPQESPNTDGVPCTYAARVGTIDSNTTWCASPQKDYSVEPVNPVVLVWLSGDFWITPEPTEDIVVDISKPAKCVMFVGADYNTGTPATQVYVGVDLRMGGTQGNSGAVIASGRATMTGSLGETKKVEFDMAWESGFDGVISGATRATVWLGGRAAEAPEPSPVGGAGASVQSYHVYDTAEFPESITIMLKQ